MKLKFLPLLLFAVAGCHETTAPTQPQKAQATPTEPPKTTALDTYLARNEPAYTWKAVTDGEFSPGDGDVNLRLVSQTWQGGDWTHRLQIFRPQNVKYKDAALININFGSGSLVETFVGRTLADGTGITVINLFNVPNQPLYGKSEDELIAYTLDQALKTGDETWPLLYPMTKSVIQAMNAVQAWSKEEGNGGEIKRFIVAGASKRGWTTYLVGAAQDPRVMGLIPIVYDNLNLAKQIPHQKQVWGQTSPLAAPYAKIGLFDLVEKPEGQKMISLIDPYAFKERLTTPKLLVNATNDGFWPHDSAQFYFNELPGDNSLLYVPNAPHTLDADSFVAIGHSAAVWGDLILSGQKVPHLELLSAQTKDGWNLTAKVEGLTPPAVRLWMANSATPDFRGAKWNLVFMDKSDGVYKQNFANSVLYRQGKYVAAFAEIAHEHGGMTLKLSSPMWEQHRD